MKTVFLSLKMRFSLLLILSVWNVGCSEKEESEETQTGTTATVSDQYEVSYAPPPPPPARYRREEAIELKAGNSETDQTKIIRKASVRFQVSDYQAAFRAIETRIKQYQGLIISTNETRVDNSLQNTLSIKVPAGNLDNLLNALTKQAAFIDFKNITSEDVSLEFVDISARMNAKKAVEQRYLELLKKATTVEDMIEIENQLLQIREEIESSQARLNYINSQVANSTINLEIYDNRSITEDTNTFGIQITNALKTGWESLLSFLFGIITLWPFLLILPVLFLIGRKLKRKYFTSRK